MAFKRTGGNPDDESLGVLSPGFADDFFSEQERQGYGASELIKAGKTDSPDDQLVKTILKSDEQAHAFADILQRAERFHCKNAKTYATYLAEALVSVHGIGRLQFLQGLTLNYDTNAAAKLMDNNKNNNKNGNNNRPIGPGD